MWGSVFFLSYALWLKKEPPPPPPVTIIGMLILTLSPRDTFFAVPHHLCNSLSNKSP